MFKNIIKGVVVASVLVGLGTVAEAGQSFSNFSTTVGRFGGSGYTSYQTKAVTGQRADVYLFNNGGTESMCVPIHQAQVAPGLGGYRLVANENLAIDTVVGVKLVFNFAIG